MDEVERLLSMGVKGIKMHPDSQRFALDDPRLFPMYDAVKGSIPVMLHMGDLRYDYSHPERLRRLLKEFPELDVIAAHLRQWRWVSKGDVTLTPEMKDNLIKSVNYALKNPLNMPE